MRKYEIFYLNENGDVIEKSLRSFKSVSSASLYAQENKPYRCSRAAISKMYLSGCEIVNELVRVINLF